MKNILFACLLIAVTGLIAQAQSYDSAIRYKMIAPSFSVAADTLIQRAITANPTDSSEGGEATRLARFKDFMGNRICNDVATGADMMAPYALALGHYMPHSGSCTGSGNWTCVGPLTSTYSSTASVLEEQGRMNAIWVDPDNPDTLLAGADNGGLWKSNDDGRHWFNISDGNTIPGTMGVAM